MPIDVRLLARLASEPPAVQQRAYRLLVGECPPRRPEQSEECDFVSKTNDVLEGIRRQVRVPGDGPAATGFPAELLPVLDEGRKRRLARQREFDGFARADLGAMWPYAVIPHLREGAAEVDVTIKLAGMAQIRRRYVAGTTGWLIGCWPFSGAGWAVLPYPDAPTECWHYAGELPDVLALADELGRNCQDRTGGNADSLERRVRDLETRVITDGSINTVEQRLADLEKRLAGLEATRHQCERWAASNNDLM